MSYFDSNATPLAYIERPHEILYPDSEIADLEILMAEGETSDIPRLDEASGVELFAEVARRAIRNATDDELIEELGRRYPRE